MKGWILIFSLVPITSYAKSVRTLTIDESDVSVIHTAPGFSTMLEFEGKPTSAVVGDQDAFKVEFVGTSVTIKAVIPRAKTNLFVFVDYERFNFTLVSGQKKDADFVVRVKVKRRKNAPPLAVAGRPAISTTPLLKRSVKRSAVSRNLRLTVTAVATPPSHSSLIIYFTLSCRKIRCKTLVPLDRSRLTLLQNRRPVPMESVYLDLPALYEENLSANGTIVVRQESLNRSCAMELKLLHDEFGHIPELSVTFFPFRKWKGE